MPNKKKILFYYSSNLRTNVLESQMIYFNNIGFNVILLTLCEEGDLHFFLKKHGVLCHSVGITSKYTIFYYLKNIVFLIRFCKSYQVDIIYSHLQKSNFISCISQFFVLKSKFIICRHHHNQVSLGKSYKAKLMDKCINLLGKDIIVPSNNVYNQLTKNEKVNSSKVHLIPYTYNFDLFQLPSPKEVEEIKKKYKADLLCISVSRLVKNKGLENLISIVENLKNMFDIKLIIAGDGELYDKLKKEVVLKKLEKNIFIIGHVKNIMDYYSGVDFNILLSENEASNNSVKEAAICNKTSIVCSDVGDFNEYITHLKNGFLVPKFNNIEIVSNILMEIYNKKYNVKHMGELLKQDVINMFQINNIINQYNKFHY